MVPYTRAFARDMTRTAFFLSYTKYVTRLHVTANSLPCRLTEEALIRHIAKTDASVTCAEAAAMVSGWFLTSNPALSNGDGNTTAVALDTSASKAARQAGAGASAVLEAGVRSLTTEEKLLANDRCVHGEKLWYALHCC